MSQEIVIYGASDDLIEVDGAVSEEFNVYGAQEAKGETLILRMGGADVARVRCFYDGCWYFAFIGTVDESGDCQVTMPRGWAVEVRAFGEREGDVPGYSMSLHIRMADEDEVTVVLEGADDDDAEE